MPRSRWISAIVEESNPACEDVTFGRSNDGVLLSDTGTIVASAFQDNVTLIKIYARIGCAIGQPLAANSNTPVKPFVAVEWASAVSAASAKSATTRKAGAKD